MRTSCRFQAVGSRRVRTSWFWTKAPFFQRVGLGCMGNSAYCLHRRSHAVASPIPLFKLLEKVAERMLRGARGRTVAELHFGRTSRLGIGSIQGSVHLNFLMGRWQNITFVFERSRHGRTLSSGRVQWSCGVEQDTSTLRVLVCSLKFRIITHTQALAAGNKRDLMYLHW